VTTSEAKSVSGLNPEACNRWFAVPNRLDTVKCLDDNLPLNP